MPADTLGSRPIVKISTTDPEGKIRRQRQRKSTLTTPFDGVGVHLAYLNGSDGHSPLGETMAGGHSHGTAPPAYGRV